MSPKTSRKKRIVYFILFAVFFLVCIPILILYSMGYTIDSSTFGLSGRGGIYVLVAEPYVNIYIGNELKETTGIFLREVLVKSLKPKDYLVLAGSDSYWPWAKFVTVLEGEVSALYPFLVPKALPIKEVLKTDTNYAIVQKLFALETKSSKIIPSIKEFVTSLGTSTNLLPGGIATNSNIIKNVVVKTSAEANGLIKKKMKIWKDGKLIFASWLGTVDRIPPYFCLAQKCKDEITVFSAFSPIGRIDFYPSRDDAIMLTQGNGVYAMEIDNRPYHNFYPIYKGKNPDFRIDGGVVYIKDENAFFSVEL